MESIWNFIHGNITNFLILVLSLLSIFDLLDMYGINVKPFHYSEKKLEKEKERIKKVVHDYMDNEQNLFKCNVKQYINFTLAEMGLKSGQSDKIFSTIEELKKSNNVISSTKCMQDILSELLQDKKIVVHLDRTDIDRHVIYPSLKYYINFNDAMNINWISSRLLSILHFYINDILKSNDRSIRDINRLVIPTESNVVLGIGLAKLLEIEPVIMLSKARRIYDDQFWDGTIEAGDRVLIVHDVIYSGDNIVDCINRLPLHSCSIFGVIALVSRTDLYNGQQGAESIIKAGVPVYSAIEVNDYILDNLNKNRN